MTGAPRPSVPAGCDADGYGAGNGPGHGPEREGSEGRGGSVSERWTKPSGRTPPGRTPTGHRPGDRTPRLGPTTAVPATTPQTWSPTGDPSRGTGPRSSLRTSAWPACHGPSTIGRSFCRSRVGSSSRSREPATRYCSWPWPGRCARRTTGSSPTTATAPSSSPWGSRRATSSWRRWARLRIPPRGAGRCRATGATPAGTSSPSPVPRAASVFRPWAVPRPVGTWPDGPRCRGAPCTATNSPTCRWERGRHRRASSGRA